MTNTFSALKANINAAEASKVMELAEALDANIYNGRIKEVSLFTTDSGAGMLKYTVEADYAFDGETKHKQFTGYQNTVKKDGEENKIGLSTLSQLIYAAGLTMDESDTSKTQVQTASTKSKCYAKEVEVETIVNIVDKPVLVAVRKIQEGDDEKTVKIYNEVEIVLALDGTNKAGEDQRDKFLEKIEKRPLIVRRPKEKTESNGKVSSTSGKAEQKSRPKL